jgi:hypothetical protein
MRRLVRAAWIAACSCKPSPTVLEFERPSVMECRDSPESSHYCVPSTPGTVTALDTDGDTVADLAVLARTGSISVLSAFATDAFARSEFLTGVSPSQADDDLLPCETNGDGRVDLVHNGDQILRAPRVWLAPAVEGPWIENRMDQVPTRGPACLDFDRDGEFDIVGLLALDAVGVRASDGMTFGAPTQLAVDLPDAEQAPRFIEFVDLDADDLVDIVGVSEETASLFVVPGNSGTAGFGTRVDHPAEVDGASAFGVADLDGDGVLDLMLAREHEVRGSLAWFATIIDEALHLETMPTIDLPLIPTALRAAEIDIDAAPELIVSRLPDTRLFVGNAMGDEWTEFDLQLPVVDYVVADLNGDLLPDLAVLRPEPSRLEVFWNRGDGRLTNGTAP